MNPAPLPFSEPENPRCSNNALWEALRQVVDPELGPNIVDLGLVYEVASHDGQVSVTMTVTTPGCPMEHCLVFGVETAVLGVPGVRGVEVAVVHEPRWDPSRMTPAARSAVGIL
ncbi:MAG: metal-sulfur cluster assembly factor [Limisphaerales bacterium]